MAGNIPEYRRYIEKLPEGSSQGISGIGRRVMLFNGTEINDELQSLLRRPKSVIRLIYEQVCILASLAISCRNIDQTAIFDWFQYQVCLRPFVFFIIGDLKNRFFSWQLLTNKICFKGPNTASHHFDTIFIQLHFIISMEFFVKVKFDTNHMISIIPSNYRDFIQKLKNTFKLQPANYYQLSYIGPNKQKVSITQTRQFIDYCKCQTKQMPTLTLRKTEDVSLHFQAEFQQPRSILEKNQALEQKYQQLKRKLHIQLQKFKTETRKQVQDELKQRWNSSKKKPKKNRSQATHNGIACQSCKFKEIVGVRYECAVCDYNICQDCEQRGYDHNPMHPLIKIKDETQMLATKNNRLSYEKEKKQELIKVEGPKIDMELVKSLMEFTQLDQAHAIAFIKQHPTKDIQQLINEIFSKQ